MQDFWTNLPVDEGRQGSVLLQAHRAKVYVAPGGLKSLTQVLNNLWAVTNCLRICNGWWLPELHPFLWIPDLQGLGTDQW